MVIYLRGLSISFQMEKLLAESAEDRQTRRNRQNNKYVNMDTSSATSKAIQQQATWLVPNMHILEDAFLSVHAAGVVNLAGDNRFNQDRKDTLLGKLKEVIQSHRRRLQVLEVARRDGWTAADIFNNDDDDFSADDLKRLKEAREAAEKREKRASASTSAVAYKGRGGLFKRRGSYMPTHDPGLGQSGYVAAAGPASFAPGFPMLPYGGVSSLPPPGYFHDSATRYFSPSQGGPAGRGRKAPRPDPPPPGTVEVRRCHHCGGIGHLRANCPQFQG